MSSELSAANRQQVASPFGPSAATTCRAWRCDNPATGVIRARSDNFIYEARCDDHAEPEAEDIWFDRWGSVGPVLGPCGEGGVRYARP